jgi:hypothetical protein
MRTRSRRLGAAAASAALVAVLLGVAATGCGPGPDGASGGDQERAAALPVALGQPVDDRVSADDGDRTDWKRFRLDSADQVNIAVYWDDPSVEAAIEVRNIFGNALGRREHTKGEPVDRMTATLDEGDYFLAIIGEGAGSVYTLEITTGAPHSGGGTVPVRKPRGGGSDDARPE